jgi:hypothetical protein
MLDGPARRREGNSDSLDAEHITTTAQQYAEQGAHRRGRCTVPTITIGSDFRVSMDSAPMVHLRYQGSGHKLWRPLGAHSLQLGAVGRGHSRYLCDQLRYASNSSSARIRGGQL